METLLLKINLTLLFLIFIKSKLKNNFFLNDFNKNKNKNKYNIKIIKQPGDGNCLFHSLSYGLGNTNHKDLRFKIVNWILNNKKFKTSGITLEEWILWETNQHIDYYCSNMLKGKWGGAIEMLVCSLIENININVFQLKNNNLIKISSFEVKKPIKKLNLLYQGNTHYDYLEGVNNDLFN